MALIIQKVLQLFCKLTLATPEDPDAADRKPEERILDSVLRSDVSLWQEALSKRQVRRECTLSATEWLITNVEPILRSWAQARSHWFKHCGRGWKQWCWETPRAPTRRRCTRSTCRRWRHKQDPRVATLHLPTHTSFWQPHHVLRIPFNTMLMARTCGALHRHTCAAPSRDTCTKPWSGPAPGQLAQAVGQPAISAWVELRTCSDQKSSTTSAGAAVPAVVRVLEGEEHDGPSCRVHREHDLSGRARRFGHAHVGRRPTGRGEASLAIRTEWCQVAFAPCDALRSRAWTPCIAFAASQAGGLSCIAAISLVS